MGVITYPCGDENHTMFVKSSAEIKKLHGPIIHEGYVRMQQNWITMFIHNWENKMRFKGFIHRVYTPR